MSHVACRTLLLADKYCSIEKMHCELNFQLLAERCNFHFINLCHKNIFVENERTCLMEFCKLRTAEQRRVSRRANEYDLVITDIRSNIGRKSIGFRGPSKWNGLKNELKCKTKFSEFVNQ